MKRFMTTTALALVMGTAAIADTTGNTDWSAEIQATEGQFFGSDLIGMRVYRSDTDYENNASVGAEARAEWDDIGEINDFVISRDGEVNAVLLGIGGFLGMGERDVAITMDDIRIVQEGDDVDDFFLVVNATKEELGTIPAYESDMSSNDAEAKDAKTKDANDTAAMNEGGDTGMAEGDGTVPPLVRPQMEREGYTEVEMVEATSMSADDLEGARVYGTNDEDVGEISELLLEDGKLTRAVIDVGGFLGIDEKPVAVAFDKLQILKNENGDDLRVYIDSTQESLEAQPEYTSG